LPVIIGCCDLVFEIKNATTWLRFYFQSQNLTVVLLRFWIEDGACFPGIIQSLKNWVE
jgi:hypothetical protein